MPDSVIKQFPEKTLRKKSVSLKKVTDAEKSVMSEMANTMYATGGIGLAAPQIGISKNMMVMDTGRGLVKMINPKILSTSGSARLEEGCLSVPDAAVTVERAEEISVSYIDEHGNAKTGVFSGLTARVIQHEIDHLNGRLIIDYLPWYKKIFRIRGAKCLI